LSQSGQLYNEADIGALGQVYCFGPTFRAEKSKTRRHLLEFWMLEMEAAYYDFDANLRFQEEMMAYTVRRVLDNCAGDLRDLGRDPAKLEPATQTPYPRLRYGEAIEIINRARFSKLAIAQGTDYRDKFGSDPYEDWLTGRISESVLADDEIREAMGLDTSESGQQLIPSEPFRWGDDFGAPDEAAIGSHYDRPVFVTNFPIEIKGFYFKDELGSDGEPKLDDDYLALHREQPHLVQPGATGYTVLGADLIGSEGAGELIGGSQREDDYERLVAKIERFKLPREYLEWYLDLRRFGNVPHSGFGVGLERTLCWLCGGSDNPVHIRETITYPRMLHQFEP